MMINCIWYNVSHEYEVCSLWFFFSNNNGCCDYGGCDKIHDHDVINEWAYNHDVIHEWIKGLDKSWELTHCDERGNNTLDRTLWDMWEWMHDAIRISSKHVNSILSSLWRFTATVKLWIINQMSESLTELQGLTKI